ncbi:hypothetical protein DT073_07790 [Microbacterium sp. ABRD28]|nr:hypothetical protein DT073_07790 [Microbacterium sp. ABRD28]
MPEISSASPQLAEASARSRPAETSDPRRDGPPPADPVALTGLAGHPPVLTGTHAQEEHADHGTRPGFALTFGVGPQKVIVPP